MLYLSLTAGLCDPPNPGPVDPTSGALAIQLTTSSGSASAGATVTIALSVTTPLGYSGGVSLAADGLPAGVTVVSSTVTTSGATSTGSVVLQVGSGVSAGNYAITVRASGAGVAAASATFSLTVQAATSEVTVQFVPCGPIPFTVLWFAYQDGTGAWTRVAGSGTTYRFNIASPVGAYAAVTSANGATSLLVNYMTRAELTAGPIGGCSTASGFGLNTLTGTIAPPLGASEVGFLYMGASGTSLGAGTSAFTFGNGPDETFDLLSTRGTNAANGYIDRLFLRRDVSAPNGSSLGALDFNGPDGMLPSAVTMLVTGGDLGGAVNVSMALLTRASCHWAGYGGPPAKLNGTSFTVFGLQPGRLRATDYYNLNVTQTLGSSVRMASETFHQLAGRSVALPAALNPTLSNEAGNYKRVRAAFTGASEYNAYTLRYFSGGRSAAVTATSAFVGTTSVALSVPVLSAVTGFSDTWPPANSAAVNWTLSSTGRTVSGTSCQDGRSSYFQATGTM